MGCFHGPVRSLPAVPAVRLNIDRTHFGAQKRLSMVAAMLLFLQLKVRLNVMSNIYQTKFDQSPAQACAIDLPELNYGL